MNNKSLYHFFGGDTKALEYLLLFLAEHGITSVESACIFWEHGNCKQAVNAVEVPVEYVETVLGAIRSDDSDIYKLTYFVADFREGPIRLADEKSDDMAPKQKPIPNDVQSMIKKAYANRSRH